MLAGCGGSQNLVLVERSAARAGMAHKAAAKVRRHLHTDVGDRERWAERIEMERAGDHCQHIPAAAAEQHLAGTTEGNGVKRPKLFLFLP